MSSETDIRAIWGKELRLERVRQDLNQTQVADMSGLDQTTISYLERGRGSIESFEAAAKALGIALQAVGA